MKSLRLLPLLLILQGCCTPRAGQKAEYAGKVDTPITVLAEENSKHH
ncbi:MAG: hypothetical protein WD708_07180 [Kiritimatiellia bacterium]